MRQPGYYWVKYGNEWTIGQFGYYNSDTWTLTMSDVTFKDEEFDEIDERRIDREPSADEKNAANDIVSEKERERWAKIAMDLAEVFNKKRS